jgi:hypothetical protein
MTYTEQDLRAVLGALDSNAPDVTDVLAELERRRQHRTVRRRVTGIAAVAAVTVALAAGSLAVPDLFTNQANQTQPAAPPGESLEYWFAVEDIPGATVGFEHLDVARQVAEVTRPGAQPVMIEAFDRGAYDPTDARTGEPLEVNGKRGFYHPRLPGPAVILEYAPDSWTLIRLPWQGEIDREELLRVARAVRFDRTTPVLVPFRVDYLPSKLRPRTGGAKVAGGGALVTVGLWAPGDETARLTITATGTPRGKDGRPVSTGNVPGTARVNCGEFTVTVIVSKVGSISDEELNRIAQSITAAGGWPDPADWIPTDQAFPTR